MAFLQGFEHDIFVSYSHVDNLGDDAWVAHFHKQLEFALAQRHGRMDVIKVWRDKRLEGDQLFDDTISTAVNHSAIFLAITSNGYLASSYCRDELHWFYEKAAAEPFGLRIGDRSRIYNVLLTRIPPERWPSEYGRISGFAFHDADDPAADVDSPGQPTDAVDDRQRFRRQLTALTNALYRMLEAFKATIEKPAASEATVLPVAPSAATGPRVFVADVTDSLASYRKRLVLELSGKGVAVESGIPPPYDPPSHDARVIDATKDALLSVHLFDELPGREIDGAEGQTYPLRQLELALGRSHSQLIWVPSELDSGKVEDSPYRSKLVELETGERAQASRHDFVRGSRTLLVSQIVDKLEHLCKSAEADARPRGAVLLDTHFKDQLYALELSRLLVGHSVQPYINPQEDDPNKNLDVFESRLRNVSSLVIIYGQVSESWVRHRLGLALQLSVVNNLPIHSFFVFIVPPAKASDALQFKRGPVPVRLIDNSGSAELAEKSVALLCEGAAEQANA